MTPCTFAIPGDHTRRTGGFIYERRLLEELRASGRAVRHLRLPDGGASPDDATRAAWRAALETLEPDAPLILDGLVFGAMRSEDLERIRPPVVAMLHHPMGLEHGLPASLARALLVQESANLRHVAHVVVTSAHTAQSYVAMGADPRRITVALPGFDAARGGTRRDAGPRILSVGLLAQRKGHDVLIEALRRIADLDWSAQIVGKTHDPAIAEALAAQIARSGLGARVTLSGELDDAALAEAFGTARLFALATRYEGYGMALAEALCHGLPIVSCAAGAVPDTVGAAALLAPPDDTEAFARHLRDVLSDAALRGMLEAASRARGAALPRWRDTAAVMSGVLDQLSALRDPP
ncbi:glycosyltransferase family 4 protein [Citreicella sp. C3M06]|uniref:glycosyltransferase family 4 protein n=1 Tax=Citreicella sp. C3M06 TaxID=2841564 RepID=UPI001C084F25|nr:glycosyltransferase family 4 protein [Citreicella sp. C3M06]MBU2961696.1 glycosyltransferase family 4 protein [Citreicella sp. C3M06]